MFLLLPTIFVLLSVLIDALPSPQLSGLVGCLDSSSCGQSSPNPIASQYPNSITGTINGTIAVVPIAFDLARSIISSQYGILTKAYESLLPGFPADSYPLIIRSIIDHDIEYLGLNVVPDFQTIHIFYPFVDLLGDGYFSFVYEKYLLVSSNSVIGIAGADSYGEVAVPATFNPSGQAYAYAAPNDGSEGQIFLDAYTDLDSPNTITTTFSPLASLGPWPLDFYVNVTNQPIFGNGVQCDQQITLFNTTLSTGSNAPIGIIGKITVAAPYLPTDSVFDNVYGLKVDVAFIENNDQPCSSLKGL